MCPVPEAIAIRGSGKANRTFERHTFHQQLEWVTSVKLYRLLIMINIDPVISAIKPFAKPAATLVINQAQRNETVIQVLKSLKLDPTQPPKDVDGVYAYALVEYGVYKPEPILKLLEKKRLKTLFGKLILQRIH